MQKRQIVNIVNFIRDVEPRVAMDLVEPVREQIALMQKYNLRGTFLLQYDALIDPVYVSMLQALDPAQFELGVWFETVQPQVEAAGLRWTGRYPWDWHVHCGFSVGYSKPEREKLVDVLFEKFRATFGYYPRVFGAWFFDAHTARYVADVYGADAFCNCKEQYGTDGYTLWGGYYGQAYYPSRTNVFVPAQSADRQLRVPLFRMLGSDPVYQYDFGMDLQSGAKMIQKVITLEPVCNGRGGGLPAWVDWYLRENFNGDCLSFGYAQAGQENSFGWSSMRAGLTDQFARLAALQQAGAISVEPMGETGRWFQNTYASTPASTIAAHTAFDDPEKSSVWYCSKFYRVNLFADHGAFRIRDLHIFDEHMPDPFEDTVCTANTATYETLPLVDGNLHSGNGILAGVRLLRDGVETAAEEMHFRDCGNHTAEISYGSFTVTLQERSISFHAPSAFSLCCQFGRTDRHMPSLVSRDDTALCLRYAGRQYGIRLQSGRFRSATVVDAEDGVVCAEIVPLGQEI